MLEADIHLSLKGFSLDVRFSMDNEVLALLGPSGAGKTLTIASIAGLVKPDRGRITYNSEVWFDSGDSRSARSGLGVQRVRPQRLPPQRRGAGLVFQNYALFPHMTVQQNLRFGLHRADPAERERRVASLIKDMQLDGLEQRLPGELSGGQKQRAALARALAPRPRVLLLDEPFSSVDSTVRMQLMNLIREVHETHRIPIILITHTIEEAYALADRMAILEHGRLLQIGTKEEVFRTPASQPVARIVGTRNILNATVQALPETGESRIIRNASGAGKPRSMRTPREGSRVVTEGGIALTVAPIYPVGTSITVCIRPSRIRVFRGPEREAQTEELPARVERVLGTGDRYELVLRPEPHGERLEAELSADAFARIRPEPRTLLYLSIPPGIIHSFADTQ